MVIPCLTQSDKVFLLGRYYDKDGYTHLDFSGAGFALNFEGKLLAVDYEATNTKDDVNRPFLAVVVDNHEPREIRLDEEKGKLILFESKQNEHHFIRVIKKTECPVDHVGYRNLVVDGELFDLPKEFANRPKCLIFGDSVTCGYGIDSKSSNPDFFTKDENYLKSYAYLLGEKLGLNMSIVACGGFPINKSPYSTAYKIDNVPDLFDAASFNIFSTYEEYPKWDNSLFIPELIIVNLGANDGAYLDENNDISKEEKICEMTSKLRLFIEKLQGFFPKSKIVIMSNLIILQKEVNEVLDTVAKEKKCYRFISTAETTIGGFKPAMHPSAEMHIFGAEELAKFLKENVL